MLNIRSTLPFFPSSFSKGVAIGFVFLFLGYQDLPSAHADSEETNSLILKGNLDKRSSVSPPPPAPENFQALTNSAFYSFSNPADVSDPETGRAELKFYFFRTSPSTVSVRAYVSGEFVGGATGVPILVGRATLAFAKDGTRDFSESHFVAGPSSGYILDHDVPNGSSDLLVSLAWMDKLTERVEITFDSVSLDDSPSTVGPISEAGAVGKQES